MHQCLKEDKLVSNNVKPTQPGLQTYFSDKMMCKLPKVPSDFYITCLVNPMMLVSNPRIPIDDCGPAFQRFYLPPHLSSNFNINELGFYLSEKPSCWRKYVKFWYKFLIFSEKVLFLFHNSIPSLPEVEARLLLI